MPDYTADQMYASAKENGTEYGGMDTMPDIVGLGLWKQGHWGVYVGNGYAIEAMGTQYGVVRTKVEDRKSTRLNSSHESISRMPSSA